MRLSLYRQGQRGQRRQARAGIAFAEEVRLCTAKKRNEGSQVKHFLRAILPALILYHEISSQKKLDPSMPMRSSTKCGSRFFRDEVWSM